ncbi:hypothetical protein [Amycolatopsis sp. NPDC003731]
MVPAAASPQLRPAQPRLHAATRAPQPTAQQLAERPTELQLSILPPKALCRRGLLSIR